MGLNICLGFGLGLNICLGLWFYVEFFHKGRQIAHSPRLHTRLDSATFRRLKDWGKRHLVPACRVVKRLLQLLPWDDDSKILVTFAIDKSLLANRDALQAAVNEAGQMVVDELAGPND